MKNYCFVGILLVCMGFSIKADNELWCYIDPDRYESQISIYNASNTDLELVDTNISPAGKIPIKAGSTYYYYKKCHFDPNHPRLACEDTGITCIHPTTNQEIIFDPRDKMFLQKLVLGTFDHATRTIRVNTPIKKAFPEVEQAVETIQGKLEPTIELYTESGQRPGHFFGCGRNVHYVIDVYHKIARVENDVTMSLP